MLTSGLLTFGMIGLPKASRLFIVLKGENDGKKTNHTVISVASANQKNSAEIFLLSGNAS